MGGIVKRFLKRYSVISMGGAALVVAGIAGGCMSESFYSNTKRFDTYQQVTAADKMDFLWVIDNSPTMAGKIDFVLNNVSALMTDIVSKKDLDWTASVITTDLTYIGGSAGTYGLHSGKGSVPFTIYPVSIDRLPYVDAWLDGSATNTVDNEFCNGVATTNCNDQARFPQNYYANYDAYRYVVSGPNKVPNFPAGFRQAKGSPAFSDPSPGGGSYTAGIAEFGQMLKDFKPTDCVFPSNIPLGVVCGAMNTQFSFWEEGLEYLYRMVSDPTLLSSVSRTGVPLTVIVLTDSDDYSCDSANDPNGCSGGSPQDQNPQPVYYPVSRYINMLTNVKKSENSYVNFFAIVSTKAEDANAPGSGGCYAESIGSRYIAVADALGDRGFTGNVCTLTGSFASSGLAQVSAILRDRGALFPLSSIPDGYDGLTVTVDGVKRVPQVDYVLEQVGERCFVKFIANIPENDTDVSIDYQSGQTAGSCP